MLVPLPKSTSEVIDQVDPSACHSGLQLEKYARIPESEASFMEHQKPGLQVVCRAAGDDNLLDRLNDRRDAALRVRESRSFNAKTNGSLTLHLARSTAWENAGISLHPVYGFAYLPGSGIKGMVRAWAETVWAPAHSDQAAAWKLIERVFGYSPHSETHKVARSGEDGRGWRPAECPVPIGSATGRVVFHDAWPQRWPDLHVDVINNHHVNYYQGDKPIPPDDTDSPVLVYFLAVRSDTTFRFVISGRSRCGDGFLDQAMEWLKQALRNTGTGAKTAAGYGRFQIDRAKPVPESARMRRYSCELKLASPAFLAGADQQRDDCELRPATLRGLLRWWWRTMHAAHMDVRTLRQLETAIWGDTKSGSSVRIALQRINRQSPALYKKNDWRVSGSSHGYQKKAILGLHYVSYGMDERSRKRWYLPDGSRWRLDVTAVRGHIADGAGRQRTEVPAGLVLRQAMAALWLLAKYGGVGSKARKGFGSLADLEIPGIESVADCKAAGFELRNLSVRHRGSDQTSRSPALEKAIFMDDVQTDLRDPFQAIHAIGETLQSFAKDELRFRPDHRYALGLPRRTKFVPDVARGIKRHASPALWSIAFREEGYCVRLATFISDRLPESESVLKELRIYARKSLPRSAQRARSLQNQSARSSSSGSHYDSEFDSRGRHPIQMPKANTRVKAELLPEKTKRGKWRAEHLDTGLQGPIQDEPPNEVSPGDAVELTVATANERQIQFRFAPPRARSKRMKRQGG